MKSLRVQRLPAGLARIVRLFDGVDEDGRRERLLALAETADRYAPESGVRYAVEDLRHDPECSDEVGVYVAREEGGRIRLRMRLGPGVQTLTRALAVVLCRGLDGASAVEVAALGREFIDIIVGGQLMLRRSQTVYYVLGRVQDAVRSL